MVTLPVSKNYYERERERNQLGTATTKLVSPHDYRPTAEGVAQVHQAQDAFDAARGRSIAANKDWAQKVADKRPAPEIAEAAKAKDLAEADFAKATTLLTGKMLPADYKPHPRTDIPSPWQVEQIAKTAYLKAKATGNAEQIAAAKKAYDAVKLPESKAATVDLMTAKHKAAGTKVTAISMKIASLDKNTDTLAEKKATAQPKLVKDLIEYKAFLERNPHMRDLTYYAREKLKDRTPALMKTFTEFRDARTGLQMNAAFRAELVKDLNAASKDLVRTAAFIDVAQQSDGAPAKDLAAADARIKDADAKWLKAGEGLKSAVTDDQVASDNRKAALAESEKALGTHNAKTAEYRKLDPVTDQRIKALEAQQDVVMKGVYGKFHSIDYSEYRMSDAQMRINSAKQLLGDKERELIAAFRGILPYEKWDNTIYDLGRKRGGTTEWSVGQFDNFAGAVKHAGKVAGEYSVYQRYMALAVKDLAEHKGIHAGLVAQYNDLARMIGWAKMGGEQALKVAEKALGDSEKRLQEFGTTFVKLAERAEATQKAVVAAKQKLDTTSLQLAKNEGRRGPLFEARVGQMRVDVNEAKAAHFTATQLADQAQADVDNYRGYKGNEMPKANGPTQIESQKKQRLVDAYVQVSKWATEDKARAESADAKKARLESVASWNAWQGTVDKAKAATVREEATTRRAADAILEVKAASFAQKLAVSAKQTIEIRAFNFLDTQKAELRTKVATATGDAKKTLQAQLDLTERAEARLGKSVTTQYQDDVPEAAGTDAKPAAGPADKAAAAKAEAEAAKAKPDTKKALDGLQATTKFTGPGKLEPGAKLEKKPDGKWEYSPAKKPDPSVSKAELNKKAKDAAVDALAEKFGAKSGELAKSLAGDLAQEITRLHAERSGKVLKVAYEKVLAGEVVRNVSVDGLRTVDTVAQVSVKAQAAAYLSNLGAYGTAEFGLKAEAGAAGAGKATIAGELTVGGSGKVYAAGGVDVVATGAVNALGLSAEIVAKAHARGEVEGLAGFGIGEHVEMMQGGKAGVEALASASAGGKLGMDGASVKLSASAEASARAAYVQNAKLGDLNVKGNIEVWAKARAEAVANFSAGMVKGNIELSGKIGASAGAGVGVQATKKLSLFGMELEVTGGVSAGKLGANVAVDVGYKNGVLRWSVDVGAALGIGINLKLSGSIDFVEVIKAASNLLASIFQATAPEFSNFIRLEALKFSARNGGDVFK